MYTFLIAVHVIVAILLIVVILMQSSKGGGLSGAFGGGGGGMGGGGQSLFGGRGAANFLQKLTVGLAAVFMVLAIGISILGRCGGEQQQSVVQQEAQQNQLSPGTSLPQPSGTQQGQGLLPPDQSQPQQQQGTTQEAPDESEPESEGSQE